MYRRKGIFSAFRKSLLFLSISVFIPCIPGIISAQTNHYSTSLTPSEKDWLRNHPVIRLAPDPEFKPIEFFDEKGNYSGIGADFLRLISRKLGIRIDIIRCTNWDDVIQRTQNRQIDMLNAVVRTPQREEYLVFPRPYLTIPSVIIVRNTVDRELTLSMLQGMRVVMVSGYGYVDLIRNKYPAIEIELAPDLKTALRKVSFGMVDAFIGDLATASFYIEEEGISNLKLAGECDPPNISGFAVRSDWPELSTILEKGISLITEQERKLIFNKWIHLGAAPGLNRTQLKNIALIVVLTISIIIIGFLLWSRTLKRLVQQRTRDLSREINERKQVEQALRESEKRFMDLIENSTDWIWEFDENEIFTYASPRIKDLLGYTPEEVIGQSAFTPMSSPEAKKVMEEFLRFKQARLPFSHLINVNRHKDGTEVILESSGVPIIGPDGSFHGYRGIDRDITSRIRLEEQLRQTYKMEAIGTLAGGIAHDFNNILSAIIGYADMAGYELKTDGKAKEYIQEVLKAGNRAKDLVKQILTFSSSRQEILQPIQPYPIIKEAMKFIRASLPSTIEIQEDLDPDCGLILANSTNLHQIVLNLSTNALQAMKNEQGTIEISLKRVSLHQSHLWQESNANPGDYIEFRVSDTGMGMSPEIINRIFEPYFTTKETGKGSGIGLAVVHRIVENSNGFIKVDSVPGKGSTFKVYFPALESSKPSSDNHNSEEESPGGKERILIADDEEIVLTVFQSFLQRKGYQVVAVSGSIPAIEVFRNTPYDFDLVITDQTMPNLPGSELAKQLLAIRPDIPIILCTGYSAIISEEQARAIGISRFIYKPVSMHDLAVTVRETLDQASQSK